MTVPAYCCRCCSSQSMLSASRWFVGSSSRRISGCWSKRRHRATRRRSPPERCFTGLSSSGQRRASIAFRSLVSIFQASQASRRSCISACRASNLSKSASGSAKAAFISSNSASRAIVSATPSRTTSMTVLSSSNLGSCSRYPTE